MSTPAPKLCTAGCGFCGTPEQNDMCSKCYKDHQAGTLPKRGLPVFSKESTSLAKQDGFIRELKSIDQFGPLYKPMYAWPFSDRLFGSLGIASRSIARLQRHAGIFQLQLRIWFLKIQYPTKLPLSMLTMYSQS
mmetsp:Transcript_20701/g.23011  ORF Transcript_20701/g.23011 Transcript_20701/m.23011 type:complete len:134 (-) Transcript_20701:423-824(-)